MKYLIVTDDVSLETNFRVLEETDDYEESKVIADRLYEETNDHNITVLDGNVTSYEWLGKTKYKNEPLYKAYMQGEGNTILINLDLNMNPFLGLHK